jgi:hypothetical protein
VVLLDSPPCISSPFAVELVQYGLRRLDASRMIFRLI